VVREVRVHDYDKVPLSELKSMDICGSQSKLPRAWLEHDLVGPVDADELFRNVLRAIRGGVVNDDELPGEIAAKRTVTICSLT
jgi:hypothetical protein